MLLPYRVNTHHFFTMQDIKVKEVIRLIEDFAPPALQEDYDNSGLQIGDPDMTVTGIVIALDVTSEVLEEALAHNSNLIVAHHPLSLSGIKTITPNQTTGAIILKAARENIAIFSAHTNIDSVKEGVSYRLAQKIGLINCRILEPRSGLLIKLVTFVPTAEAGKLRAALFEAGAGHIGHYDACSYNLEGEGTFRAGEETNPYVGKKGEIHTEKETRIETIFPAYHQNKVIRALVEAHPYEEPAYDLYPLNNSWQEAGFGIVGQLPAPVAAELFLKNLKTATQTGCIRHTALPEGMIKTVAVCGGSGSFLVRKALAAGAEVFVTADIKYHQFFETSKSMMIADIGHYESEQFTKELFFELLTKNFPNFAIRLSNVNTNPIKYY